MDTEDPIATQEADGTELKKTDSMKSLATAAARKRATQKAAKPPAEQKPEIPSSGDTAQMPMEQYQALSSLFGKNPGGSALSSI